MNNVAFLIIGIVLASIIWLAAIGLFLKREGNIFAESGKHLEDAKSLSKRTRERLDQSEELHAKAERLLAGIEEMAAPHIDDAHRPMVFPEEM